MDPVRDLMARSVERKSDNEIISFSGKLPPFFRFIPFPGPGRSRGSAARSPVRSFRSCFGSSLEATPRKVTFTIITRVASVVDRRVEKASSDEGNSESRFVRDRGSVPLSPFYYTAPYFSFSI